MNFLLIITLFSHSMHVQALGVSSLFSSINCFSNSLNVVLCFLHSMHTFDICKIPSWKKLFLAFYAYTWCLLSFCECVQSNFVSNSSWIVQFNSNLPAIRTKDLLLVQTCFKIGKIIFWFTFNNNIFIIIHMPSLLEFRKMSFPIHFDFSLLAGIIIRPLFTTFYPCFIIIFFHIRYMVLHKMFLEILSPQYMFLPSTATSCSSLFFNIFDILHIL